MAHWRTPREWFIDECTRLLTKSQEGYELRVPNDMDALRGTLRKGDVILVEGDQRVSEVIRYLTQSSWSHSAMYIGDELLNSQHGHARRVKDKWGDSARYLVVEALVGEGVILNPIAKYEQYNIRICRPQGLVPKDLQTVLDTVIGHLGDAYDIQHIYDLARYFFPISLVPRRWRSEALHFGSDREHEVICSTLIAGAFARVGYPILPTVRLETPVPRQTGWRRWLPKRTRRIRARFRACNPNRITPRSFDLSPFFEIIKFNNLEGKSFTYRDIVWERSPEGISEVSSNVGDVDQTNSTGPPDESESEERPV